MNIYVEKMYEHQSEVGGNRFMERIRPVNRCGWARSQAEMGFLRDVQGCPLVIT